MSKQILQAAMAAKQYQDQLNAGQTPVPQMTPATQQPMVGPQQAAGQQAAGPQMTPSPGMDGGVQSDIAAAQQQMQQEQETSPYEGMTPAPMVGPQEGTTADVLGKMGMGQPQAGQIGMVPKMSMSTQVQSGVPGLGKSIGLSERAAQDIEKSANDLQESWLKLQQARDSDPVVKDWTERRQGEIQRLVEELSPRKAAEFSKRVADLRAKQLEKISTAKREVDPNKFWKERSNGDKVMGAFALLAGGIGAALTNGQNLAWKIIDDAIARDISAQEFNIASAQQEAADIGQQISQEYQLRDMQIESILQTKAVYDSMILDQLSNYEKKAKNEEQRYNLRVAVAQAQGNLSETLSALYEKAADRQITTYATELGQERADAKTMLEMRKMQTGWGLAPDAPEAAKVRLADTSYRKSMDTLKRLEAFVQRSGTDPNNPTERGEVDALVQEFIGIQQAMVNSGTLNEGEYQVFLENSPITKGYFDPWKTKDKSLGMIKATREAITNIASNTAAAYFPGGTAEFASGPYTKNLETAYRKKTGTEYRANEIGGQ